MLLSINNEWRIASTEHCWILQRARVTDKGETVWQNKAYHATLADLLPVLGEKALRHSDATTLAAALAELEVLASAVRVAIQGALAPAMDAARKANGQAPRAPPPPAPPGGDPDAGSVW